MCVCVSLQPRWRLPSAIQRKISRKRKKEAHEERKRKGGHERNSLPLFCTLPPLHSYSMSTQSKQQLKRKEASSGIPETSVTHVLAQFVPADDPTQTTGPVLNLPTSVTTDQLEHLLNELLSAQKREKKARGDEEEEDEEDEDTPVPYVFAVDETSVRGTLHESILEPGVRSTEETLQIRYTPQAVFRVRPVTRCSSSLPGHKEAVLNVSFSPDGEHLASGSGDTTVRIWDLQTETPRATCQGHRNWVLCVAWSPDGRRLASGSMDNTVGGMEGKGDHEIQRTHLLHHYVRFDYGTFILESQLEMACVGIPNGSPPLLGNLCTCTS